MLDNLLLFIHAYGIVVIILLLITKFVLYVNWDNRKKNFVHLFYIDERRIYRAKSIREMRSIKVQNILGFAIICLLLLWVLIAAFMND